MPLLRRSKWSLLPPPRDVTDDQLVYCIKFTGEVFVNYEDYLQRVSEYICGQWTCELTGKSSLAYEDALESERIATEKLNEFPETHIEPVVRMLHHAHGNIESIVDKVYGRYKRELCVGEKVQYKLPGTKKNVTVVVAKVHIIPVVEKSPSPVPVPEVKPEVSVKSNGVDSMDVDEPVPSVTSTSEEELKVVPKAVKKPTNTYEYEVRLPKNVTKRIPENSLSRKRIPITRRLLHNFIKNSADHEPYPGAPWVAKDKYVKMFRLPTSLDAASTAAKAKYEDRQFRKKKEEEEKAKAQEAQEEKRAIEKKEKKRVEVQEIRYPIEDKELPLDPDLDDMPIMATDFMVGQENVSLLLQAYHFLHSFHNVIALAPFSFDDWEKAICHASTNGSQDPRTAVSALIKETLSALLDFLINNLSEEDATLDNKEQVADIINMRNASWADALQLWVDYRNVTPDASLTLPDCLQNIIVARGLTYSIRDTLEVIMYLCYEVASLDEFRNHIDELRNELKALNTQRRSEVSEYRKRMREEEKERRLQNAEEESDSVSDSDSESSSDSNDEENANERQKTDPALIAKAHSSRREMLEYKRMMREMEEAQKRKEAEKEAEIRAIQLKERNEIAQERKRKELEKQEMERKEAQYNTDVQRLAVFRQRSLGKDKNFRTYWLIDKSRIHIETPEGKWGYLYTVPEVIQLINHLNIKGTRECHLRSSLTMCFKSICAEMKRRVEDDKREEDSRRSSRLQVKSKEHGFMHYTNSLRDANESYNWES
eukprot:CFRG0904T1